MNLSNREKTVYEALTNAFGMESDAIRFGGGPSKVPSISIFVWRASDRREQIIFGSIGMSRRQVPGQRFAAELIFRIRGSLDAHDERLAAMFVANLSRHPFQHQLSIDWNHILRIGDVPLFPSCDGVVLWSDAVGESDHLHDADGEVRFLTLIPVTAQERDISRRGGTSALKEHWARMGLDPGIRR